MRISKDGSMFCYPEYIPAEMQKLFARLRQDNYLRDLTSGEFIRKAAHFLAPLNAIHPFRDGNGRAQLAFLALLASQTGHPLRLRQLRAQMFLAAMIASFHGEEKLLREELRRLLASGTQ